MEGARVSDLLSVRPGPVQPVVWLRGREQGHAPRDRSPGPRPLKAGRGSRCDSADNRGASVALPPPSRAPPRYSRHVPSGTLGWALCHKPLSFT